MWSEKFFITGVCWAGAGSVVSLDILECDFLIKVVTG